MLQPLQYLHALHHHRLNRMSSGPAKQQAIHARYLHDFLVRRQCFDYTDEANCGAGRRAYMKNFNGAKLLCRMSVWYTLDWNDDQMVQDIIAANVA